MLLVVAKVFSGLASIAAGVVLARWLSRLEYGTYSQLILIVSTLTLFSTLSLPRSLYYFIPRADSDEDKKNIAAQVLFLTMISSLVFALLLYPLATFLAEWMHNEEISRAVIYMAVYLFLLSVSSVFEPLLISLGHAKTVAGVEGVAGIGSFLAVFIPLAIGLDFRSILLFMGLVCFLKIVFAVCFLSKLKGVLFSSHLFHGVWQKIKYSAPLAISSMINVIGRRIDQFIISAMFLPAQYALYARGAFELPLVSILPMTISNLMLPRYAKDIVDGRTERVVWQFADKARKVALLFFPLTVLMYILAEAFIVFLFSEKYIGSVPVFRVYLLLLPVRITVHGVILRASGETHKFIIGDFLFVLSNVVFSVVLIKIVGMTGAAWGTVLSVLIYTTYILKINCRILEVTMTQILPWLALCKIMLSSIFAGLISWIVLRFLNDYLLQLISVSIVFTAVYLSVGYLFKIYTEGDVLLCRQLVAERLPFLIKSGND
jgi:O-antigen/teichoic acid export membrane protein